MAEFVYAPNKAVELRGTAAEISLHLAKTDVISVTADVFAATVGATPGTWDCYPVRLAGAASDEWQERDTAAPDVDDGLQSDGHWQFTRAYRDIALATARQRLANDVTFVAARGQQKQLDQRDQQQVLIEAVRALAAAQWGADPRAWPVDLTALGKVEQVRVAEKQKLAAVEKLTDMAAVRAYDVYAGWPA